MRIAICTAQVPFVSGGAELQAQNLKLALIEHGHEADIVSMPFKWYPPYEIINGMLMWRLADLEEVAGKPVDRVIGLKFPAYLVRHHNKVLWILHQHRQAYDLWNTPFGDLKHYPEGTRVRGLIIEADNRFIPEARRVYAESKTVAERLKRFNHIDSVPLYHPPPHREISSPADCGDYIFYPSRLESIKRQILLIEAMVHVKSKAHCVLAGTGPDEAAIRRLIASRNLTERVRLLGFVTDELLSRYYAKALAVFFGPVDEDYGYVTLEAFRASKAVITLTDSGAPLEFVEDGHNGFVCAPDPEVIASRIDELFFNRQRARDMGHYGSMMLEERGINWSTVVEKLTA
jgi:glycosyltransferase involved in cell wall biosynthesis